MHTRRRVAAGHYRLELRDAEGNITALERYAPHAEGLVFRHPVHGGDMRMVAPLAADLAAAATALRGGAREVVAGAIV